MSHGDDLRTYYVVLNCSSLISAPDTNLNLVEFDWNSADSVWSPINLSLHYTATFGCKKNGLEDVSAASLALHAQNFASATEKNIVPKFTNRLSLTRHKMCKRFSLSQISPYMDRIQGSIQETTYHWKPSYLHVLLSVTYFTY